MPATAPVRATRPLSELHSPDLGREAYIWATPNQIQAEDHIQATQPRYEWNDDDQSHTFVVPASISPSSNGEGIPSCDESLLWNEFYKHL